MLFTWYKIVNLNDFLALDLVSRTLSLTLDGIGLKDILICKGVGISVLFDDVLLRINLNNRNPFIFEDRAVYLDPNDDIWVGVLFEN